MICGGYDAQHWISKDDVGYLNTIPTNIAQYDIDIENIAKQSTSRPGFTTVPSRTCFQLAPSSFPEKQFVRKRITWYTLGT
ncbi:hypothetical protein PtrV1_08160 [Pyrenophora tritici-repentis]|uniref:Uncharacterized protein n=1 Tax=Pyrenophora tritici-repentis TaxID=45151 RepID=A0A317A6Q8_9PLEO|nr:hypothetical protein PtrV1_08160 [Pyrenophora tritici-repentis]KAF7570792.1 hypothetical protein PtrM4_107940 [Pyrenophora tritici-repentis]KAI1514313.1 hypothetical protein Ptr86124_006943 [Pyrenophora tritici-repentis]KAI1587865.1 hypothetical protein PtrEW7m1_000844 [Pyrenophora tritici-repentis]KAI1599795.1 hypothetical protein PtrEW13061_000829 [Pyrenophora tritici-repentis]